MNTDIKNRYNNIIWIKQRIRDLQFTGVTMKNKYFTIPNILGYIRIALLPVFLVMYYNSSTLKDYIMAFIVLAVGMLTDAFDGMIARKFNQVTDFGKALDPVADKLTQGALAIAVTFHYKAIIPFLVLFIIKEVYMGVMGLYLIKKHNRWIGAQWFGKICTITLDVGMFVLLLFPNLNSLVADGIIIVMTALLIFSLANYIKFHIGLIKECKAE